MHVTPLHILSATHNNINQDPQLIKTSTDPHSLLQMRNLPTNINLTRIAQIIRLLLHLAHLTLLEWRLSPMQWWFDDGLQQWPELV